MQRIATAIFIGLIALGLAACSGNKNAQSGSSGTSGSTSTVSANGQKVYAANCSSCHQPNGQGMPGAFPPLANNPVVTGDPKKLIHIVKYGTSGKITVHGQTFNGMMPAWSQLSDGDIASVVTYVRSSWGNSAGAVTQADVSAVSK